MDWYSVYIAAIIVFIILISACIIICLALKKEKQIIYTKLDKLGSIFNFVLSILYLLIAFLVILGMFDALFSTSGRPTAASFLHNIIDDFTNFILLCSPSVSVISIISSVVLRRKGKSVSSFIVQFLPFLIFLIILLLNLKNG